MSEKYLDFNCRAYEWSSVAKKPAPWPKFDPKKINEERIAHEERFKEAVAWIENGEGFVEWTSQEAFSASEKFNAEIIRAFKANGLKSGSIIHVTFGCRGYDASDVYDLTI